MAYRMLSLIRMFAGAAGAAVALLAATSAAASPVQHGHGYTHVPRTPLPLPTVARGLHVQVYAQVAEPMKLSFAPDGALYAGRQPGDRIHRIGWGGHPVTEFGPPMVDPDAVLVDARGRISGHAHSVLVGGGGILAAIYANQASAVIFNTGFSDVDDMKFDHHGRLVFSDDAPRVLASNGGPPVELFATPSRPGSIAIDDDDRIYVGLADGTIRIYNPDGTVANAAFATGMDGLDTYLAFGDGAGGFGKSLYVLNGHTLLRFDRNGHASVIGTGFNSGPSSGTGFTFGPDHALYISDYDGNRILRISHGDRHDRNEWWHR